MSKITNPTSSATSIKFEVNSDDLPSMDNTLLAQFWHIAQANPAPFGDPQACEFAEQVGREIIRRWVGAASPALWTHQARHVQQARNLVGVKP
jgi:hypothetical protein